MSEPQIFCLPHLLRLLRTLGLLPLLLVLLLAPVMSAAGTPTAAPATMRASDAGRPTNPEQLIRQVQRKYQQFWSLECDFSQTVLSSGRLRQAEGTAVFYRFLATPQGKRPEETSVMRWNYSRPSPQIILNDGKEITIYTPEDAQVMVAPAEGMESDPSYAVFTGSSTLGKAFIVSASDPLFTLNEPKKGTTAVILTPREPHAQIKRIQLWVTEDYTLQRLLMEDHFGSLTELSFSKLQFNRLSPRSFEQRESLLHLELPPGTEMLRQ